MTHEHNEPKRDCSRCSGYTFPNGCADLCDLFSLIDEDDFDFEPSESRGENICDNCLVDSCHCPGQLDCEKWHSWIGTGKAADESDMEPRTIGFHLLDSESN